MDDLWVQLVFRAQVVVLGHNVIDIAFDREGALEDGREALRYVALMVDYDSRPAQSWKR